MNELATISKLVHELPNCPTKLQRTENLFNLINCWEDVENFLLRGDGLSARSYKTYLTAVRQLYDFTKELHPFQVTPGHIEAFYDDRLKKDSINTAYNKIQGLKKFFSMVDRQTIAGSPFDGMSDKLRKKISKTRKTRTKKALTRAEVKAILKHLRDLAPLSVQGAENLAIVMLLVTSGLRASEVCSLRWKDLAHLEDRWTATFVGKGGDLQEQELYPEAVALAREYFERHFGRKPRLEEYLFYTIPNNKTWAPKPFTPHNLWQRVKKLGAYLRNIGVLKRELTFSPHLFRRTYATLLYKSGMKLKAVMEKTRHANIEVLAKHYIDDGEPASPYFDQIFN